MRSITYFPVLAFPSQFYSVHKSVCIAFIIHITQFALFSILAHDDCFSKYKKISLTFRFLNLF